MPCPHVRLALHTRPAARARAHLAVRQLDPAVGAVERLRAADEDLLELVELAGGVHAARHALVLRLSVLVDVARHLAQLVPARADAERSTNSSSAMPERARRVRVCAGQLLPT